MRRRIKKLLSIALIHHAKVLILGAWGCGMFKNSPMDVANYFKEQLIENKLFRNKFKIVLFAILDNLRYKSNLAPFEKVFS